MRRLISSIQVEDNGFYDDPYMVYEDGTLVDMITDRQYNSMSSVRVVLNPSKYAKQFISYIMYGYEAEELIKAINDLDYDQYFEFIKDISYIAHGECDLQQLFDDFMIEQNKDYFTIHLDDMGVYNALNQLFHNNIPINYLLHYITDEMLAYQIEDQGLGKPRKTDKDYNDIVRRYVNKHKTLDDIDFANIVEQNFLEEDMCDDLTDKFGVHDEKDDYLYLNCTDSDVIQFVQSFQPKKLDISQDARGGVDE